jgi:hypothetical protein
MKVLSKDMKFKPETAKSLVGSGQIMELMRIQGIAEEWVVFNTVESDEDVVFVVHAPTSGSFQGMQKFADTWQEVEFFQWDRNDRLDYWRKMDEACHYALRSASEAVLTELTA